MAEAGQSLLSLVALLLLFRWDNSVYYFFRHADSKRPNWWVGWAI